MSMMARCRLLALWITIVISCCVTGIATVGCIVLLARLWANAAEASKAWATLAMVIIVVSVSH